MMKYICSLICLFLIPSLLFGANIYVDQTCVDCNGSDTYYNPTTRACVAGSGVVNYQVLEDALDNMSGGDDVYLRGGSYTPVGRYADGLDDADFYVNYSKNGTSENHSSIQSYAGEWAILEGSGNMSVVLGHVNQDKDGLYQLDYWDISRLEVDGNGVSGSTWAGIGWNGNNNTFKYLYIHDNKNTAGTSGSVAGMILWIPENTTVDYCYFDDNGCTSDDNNCTQIAIISDYSYTHNNCTTYHWFVDGPYAIAHAVKGNEFAYNYFTIEAGTLIEAFQKYKSETHLTGWLADNENIVCADNTISEGDLLAAPDMTYKDYGDDWHHNIAPGQGAHIGQDFAQFYNNIVGGYLKLGPTSLHQPQNVVAYNNTVLGAPIRYSGTSSGYFPTAIGNNTQPMVVSLYNNLLASPSQQQYSPTDQFLELAFLTRADAGVGPQTYAGYYNITNNYVYDTQAGYDSDHQVNINSTDYTIAEFNTAFSVTNYIKASSEGSDNLMTGASGADQYITRGSHVIADGVTIADGGYDGAHPYLSGVTIPDYVGAVNPSDSDWVSGVLGLDATYFTSATAGSEPSWVEGEGSGSSSTPTCQGISVQ